MQPRQSIQARPWDWGEKGCLGWMQMREWGGRGCSLQPHSCSVRSQRCPWWAGRLWANWHPALHLNFFICKIIITFLSLGFCSMLNGIMWSIEQPTWCTVSPQQRWISFFPLKLVLSYKLSGGGRGGHADGVLMIPPVHNYWASAMSTQQLWMVIISEFINWTYLLLHLGGSSMTLLKTLDPHPTDLIGLAQSQIVALQVVHIVHLGLRATENISLLSVLLSFKAYLSCRPQLRCHLF